jgi:hypothetical protein
MALTCRLLSTKSSTIVSATQQTSRETKPPSPENSARFRFQPAETFRRQLRRIKVAGGASSGVVRGGGRSTVRRAHQ